MDRNRPEPLHKKAIPKEGMLPHRVVEVPEDLEEVKRKAVVRITEDPEKMETLRKGFNAFLKKKGKKLI